MKTTMSVRVLAIALVAAFTLAFSGSALANDDQKNIPVELKFIGNLKDQPLFHLVFKGDEVKEYNIVIRDENGSVYYRETVKGANFIKKFLLNLDEMSDSGVKFEVTAKGNDKPVVFEVNNESRFVEEIVVNKVK